MRSAHLLAGSRRPRLGVAGPEPARAWYEVFQLPASAWVTVPVQFIEILVMVTPSSYLPTLLGHLFDNSTTLQAVATGVTDSVGGMIAFFLSPTLGCWSDTYGRKPLLIWLSLLSFMPIFALSFYPYLSLWVYLGLRGLGKMSAFGILFSCVADVCPARRRAQLFSQTSGLGMTAMVVGPVISLQLHDTEGFRICGGLAVAVMAYLIFLQPETLWIGLKREEREQLSEEVDSASEKEATEQSKQLAHAEETYTMAITGGSTHPDLQTALLTQQHHAASSSTPSISSINHYTHPGGSHSNVPTHAVLYAPASPAAAAQASEGLLPYHASDATVQPNAFSHSNNPFNALRLALVSGRWDGQRLPALRLASLVLLCSQLAQNGVSHSAALYLHDHLKFDKDDNSRLLIAMGSWTVFILVLLMPLLLRKVKEKHLLVAALAGDFVHQLTYVLLPDKKYMWFIAAFQGIGLVAYPAACAVLSQCVGKEQQGAVLAISAGIRSLTQGVSPILFNGLLALFTVRKGGTAHSSAAAL